MANEELLKRIQEAAKKAAESKTPEQAPQPEVAPEPEIKPSSILEVAKEKLAQFGQKLKEGVPEAAKKIVGEAGEAPKDARVFAIVEGLLVADEAQLADPVFMRGVGEKLVGVIHETGYFSPTGREARKYLDRIVAEHGSLVDLRERAMVEIAGASGRQDDALEPEEQQPEDLDPEMTREMKKLYDETQPEPLRNTPLSEDLKNLQYRFRVDPGAAYDGRLIDEAVKRIVEKGHKEGLDEKLVQMAVDRVRGFERFTDIRMQKHRERLQGGRSVQWAEIKGSSPNPDLHPDDAVFPDFRYIPAADVETIIKGEQGEAQWYFNFIDQIYSLGREETRPTLTQDQRFQEFKDFLQWKYGPEYNLAVQMYQKHWDSRGQFEYAVKGMLYNPGDVKDRLKAMSLLTGADLDHLYKNFDHSNIAATLYEHVIFETMAEKRAAYNESIKYLKEETDWNGKRMSREDILKELKKKQMQEGFDPVKGVKTESPLTIEDQKLMHELQLKNDLVAEGVMLWDDDVQSFTELHLTLTKLNNARQEFERKRSLGEPVNPKEAENMEEINRLYEIYAKREQMLNQNVTQELLETRGLSPVDIEVRKRLVDYLQNTNGGKTPAEYEVRMALWAARTAMIGSGRMAMIGAMMSVAPRSAGFEAASGKDVMRAPAFEDIQRIFNPEVFAKRFSIGGDLGLTARSILRQNLLRSKGLEKGSGFGFKVREWWNNVRGGQGDGYVEEPDGKLTESKSWKHHRKHEHNKEVARAMDAAEFAEDVTGISFNELLGPGFMASGGFYDGTAWRLEKGVYESWRKKILDMKKLPDGAKLLDNQALSIQLLVAANAAERKPILDRMLRRNPSKFLELLEGDTERILAKNGVTGQEWKIFKESLSLAETRMANEKAWQFARIDLADKKDFDALFAPFLAKLGIGEARHEVMRQVLIDIQKEVYRSRKVELADKVVFHNKMDAVAHLRLPLTMSLTDFDWKETNFYQLGTVAMHRRIRDVGAQMRARDGMLELISNQEMLLSPNDYTKSLEKMKEIREAIVDYSGADAGEVTVKEMARMFLEINRHRSLGTIGWIPGATWLARQIAEADLRDFEKNPLGKAWIWGAEKLMGAEKIIMPWRADPHMKLKDLPHSVAESISYSSRFTGSHANAWDEAKMEEVITTMHDMGMFINHPEFVLDLRKEFHTRLGDRWFAMIRKYWFVIFIATVALAAEQTISSEGKQASH
jgi:hypothetical protein